MTTFDYYASGYDNSRWDIVIRAMQIFESGCVKKSMDENWTKQEIEDIRKWADEADI